MAREADLRLLFVPARHHVAFLNLLFLHLSSSAFQLLRRVHEEPRFSTPEEDVDAKRMKLQELWRRLLETSRRLRPPVTLQKIRRLPTEERRLRPPKKDRERMPLEKAKMRTSSMPSQKQEEVSRKSQEEGPRKKRDPSQR